MERPDIGSINIKLKNLEKIIKLTDLLKSSKKFFEAREEYNTIKCLCSEDTYSGHSLKLKFYNDNLCIILNYKLIYKIDYENNNLQYKVLKYIANFEKTNKKDLFIVDLINSEEKHNLNNYGVNWQLSI